MLFYVKIIAPTINLHLQQQWSQQVGSAICVLCISMEITSSLTLDHHLKNKNTWHVTCNYMWLQLRNYMRTTLHHFNQNKTKAKKIGSMEVPTFTKHQSSEIMFMWYLSIIWNYKHKRVSSFWWAFYCKKISGWLKQLSSRLSLTTALLQDL